MMTIDQLLTSLESHEKVLAQHIEMAKAGKIQEDCICCREKDLQEIRDQLACVRAMFDDLTSLQEEVKALRDSVEFHKKRGNAMREIAERKDDTIDAIMGECRHYADMVKLFREKLAPHASFDELSLEVTITFDDYPPCQWIWRFATKRDFELARDCLEGCEP